MRDPDHLNTGDVRFPGTPNVSRYVSTRPISSFALRSTLSSNIVNELRGGITRGGASYFGEDASNGPQTFADLDGYALDFGQNIGLTNWIQNERTDVPQRPELERRRPRQLAEGTT